MTLYIMVAIPLWVVIVSGALSMPTAVAPLFWHQHEMLFGFLSAGIAGFLLTAVCVWTKTERTHGARLLALWLVWLLGRGLLSFGGGLDLWIVQGANLLFLPLVILDAGWRILKVGQYRQLVLLALLVAIWLTQLAWALEPDPRWMHSALVLAMALMSIIGGRIVPAFTRNWLKRTQPSAPTPWSKAYLDFGNLFALFAVAVGIAIAQPTVTIIAALLAAALLVLRLVGWKGWLTRKEPLLWILHVSLLWIPISLLLLVGHLHFGWPPSAWSHAAGVGGVGGLILGVISRVALGHTGRPMVLPKGMVWAFYAIHLAAVIRVATALNWISWHPGVGTSSVLWIFAYGMFCIRYIGILASPRADGKEG